MEYHKAGISLQSNLSDCDVLLGIKEVPVHALLPGKTYMFFSHTTKKQLHNRPLLQAILEKKIHLIDYEVLTDENGQRLIAFGFFAGMVGAHNALWTYGRRSGSFHLPRMKDLLDYGQAKEIYRSFTWPPVKVVVTGTGRVGSGAVSVLTDMGFRQVTPHEFITGHFLEPVFTWLGSKDYYRCKVDGTFDKSHFYAHPDAYVAAFEPFFIHADILINGIFWHPKAPVFFTRQDMLRSDFNIQVIADITCDIGEHVSIPSTLKASTIEDPVFGYDPATAKEIPAFQPTGVDMMTIDNLPSELPRDASTYFGERFVEMVLPELVKQHSEVIERATVAKNGRLGEHFQYLEDFVAV